LFSPAISFRWRTHLIRSGGCRVFYRLPTITSLSVIIFNAQ